MLCPCGKPLSGHTSIFPLFFLWLRRGDYCGFFLFEDGGCGCDTVTFVETKQADALRRPAGFADFA